MVYRNSTTEVVRLMFSGKQAVLERLRLQRGAENSVDGAKILSEWLESLDELMAIDGSRRSRRKNHRPL